jgi:CoA:oxalate CoA-transferase
VRGQSVYFTVYNLAKDPRLGEREMLVKIDDPVAGEMYVPGVTIKLSRTPGRIGPVPAPGQHTVQVLENVLGLDHATIEALRRDGAVA